MATIENTRGRRMAQAPSGYTRLFGDAELGNLMSRVQGAVISSGTELEKLIWERVQQIADFDSFISSVATGSVDGVYVASKNQVRKSRYINAKYEPDFLIFDIAHRVCYVIEVKDGDQFDTKKAASEHTALHAFADSVRYALPLEFQIRICCFNAQSRMDVYNGLKHKFAMSEVLTGGELCTLLRINYLSIVASRSSDQQANIDYFVTALLSIPCVRSIILEQISEH